MAAVLDRFGLRADKRFGQNFLVDRSALEAIVAAAELGPADTVLEVGPGLGVLTRELAARAGAVRSLELDERLLPVLAFTLQGLANVEVVAADALDYDFGVLPQRAKFVANLPYNIATPVVMRALAARTFERLVFLVQREVAERMTAGAGDPAYGALTLRLAIFGEAEIVRHVAPGCFEPAPKVTSSVVRIRPFAEVRVDPHLLGLIEAGFRHRRKTLAKNLQMAGVNRAATNRALEALGIDRRVRAEALDLAQMRHLLAALVDAGVAVPTAEL